MNWWPWQTKQAPARTADSTAPISPLGEAHWSGIFSPPIDDMTYLASCGARLMGNAIEEANRGPGQGEADIEWYRRRAKSAEAEAKKLRAALLEIACSPQPLDDGGRSEWKAALLIAISLAERALDIKSSAA